MRFDHFVRSEPLHEQPGPFDIVFNQLQPFDVLLLPSDATDPRDQAIRKCDPIPYPLVSSTIHNMHFTPAVVFRPSSPHHHRLRVPFATDPHPIRCIDILARSAFLRGSCIIIVDVVLLGEVGLCLNPSAVAVSFVTNSVRRGIITSGSFALCHGKNVFRLVSRS